MNIYDLSPSQLRQAATLKEQMAKLQKELNSILGTSAPAPTSPKKQKMSPAAKAKLSAKLKEVWAKRRATKSAKIVPAPKLTTKTVPAATPAPKKWKISPAGMARIKAASKAYWAAKKKAQKK